jgi:hypothetical protein
MSILRNSFLVHCGHVGEAQDQDEDLFRRYGSITVRLRPESPAGGLHLVENEHYSLLMRGHFYCENAKSLDPSENLKLLLGAIAEQPTLHSALSTVAGGMFALFIVDHRRGLLHATTDRLGYSPVFYQEGVSGVEFSNNQFAFQKSTTLSDVAVCEYLKYGHLPFTDSLFDGVRRIHPGQIATVTLLPEPQLEIEARRYRAYLPTAERIQNPEEGAERLAEAFDCFFSRIGSDPGVAGLSGGYDSRVAAAYMAPRGISLFNFGNPASREVKISWQVAQRLGRPLESFPIPVDAVAHHGNRFKSIMQTLDSFEDVHIFELADRVVAANASYAIDGFVGDSVVGSNYYYKLSGGSGLIANLRLRERFESPIQGVADYIDKLYANKRAVPDDSLLGLIDADASDAIRRSAKQYVEEHLPWCQTHEDMIESLTQVTRGRCLIAGGPITVGAYALCACPFIDNKVFDTAMNCAKHVRAGDRLYNAFWRKRFPELADIPKANTGGLPRNGDRTYRLKHLAASVLRQAVYPRLKRLTHGLWDRSDDYSSAAGYMACPANQGYLKDLAERYESLLPPRVSAALSTAYANGTLTPAVALRLGTLMAYLGN